MKLSHHRQGEGEPLLLMHGVGHHWQGWLPVIDRLAERYDVIAVDTPGFGQSPALEGAPSVLNCTDAIAEFLEEEGIEFPHACGNSMGGAMALELGRRGLARSVCAISPAGFWTEAELKWTQGSLGLLEAVPGLLKSPVLSMVGTRPGRTAMFFVTFGRPWQIPADEARAALRDLWESKLGPALDAFDGYRFERGEELAEVPVTVLWGSRDLLLPYGLQAPRARDALPHARHVTLEGLGHVPMSDDPGMVAAAIERACQSPTAVASSCT